MRNCEKNQRTYRVYRHWLRKERAVGKLIAVYRPDGRDEKDNHAAHKIEAFIRLWSLRTAQCILTHVSVGGGCVMEVVHPRREASARSVRRLARSGTRERSRDTRRERLPP